MGRQVEASLSEGDEQALLDFLRTESSVQIIRAFSPSQDALFVDSFEPRGEGNWHWRIQL